LSDHLAKLEAEARKVSIDELNQKEVNSKLRKVSDRDIKNFYDEATKGAPPGQAPPLDKVKDRIKEKLERDYAEERKDKFFEELKKKYKVAYKITRPKVEIGRGSYEPMGSASAPIEIVEFSDYQCPFCARHARETLAEIDKTYVSTGKLRYVFRNFPIEGIHPLAFRAHEAAACAAEQGKFWEMHARLFGNQKALDPENLPKHAETIGLEMSRFRTCFDSRRLSVRIRQDIAEGRALGVNGTPMFFLGVTQPKDGKVKALRMLRGSQDFEAFRNAIESLLAPPK